MQQRKDGQEKAGFLEHLDFIAELIDRAMADYEREKEFAAEFDTEENKTAYEVFKRTRIDLRQLETLVVQSKTMLTMLYPLRKERNGSAFLDWFKENDRWVCKASYGSYLARQEAIGCGDKPETAIADALRKLADEIEEEE